MKNFFKKIGTQVILITLVAMLISSATILVVTLTRFRAYNNNQLIQRSYVGMQVLENDVKTEVTQLEDDYWMWEEDGEFVKAVNDKNTSYFSEHWASEYATKPGNFCAVLDSSNTVLFKSSNYAINSFDTASIVNGKKVSGLMISDDHLVAIYAAPLVDVDAEGALIIGFNMDESTWLENVKKQAECDVTIFKGNIRYSTTLDKSLLGTAMADNIKKEVIDGKNEFEGTATIGGAPYFVSYAPMYDVDNKVVGAYFAGFNAGNANNEFLVNELIAIAIGIVCLIIAGIIIFIFVRKKVITPIKEASKLAKEMSDGQFDHTDVTYVFSDNEVGIFAKELVKTKEDLSACITDVSRILNAMAGGDFTEQPATYYPGDFEAIKDNLLKIEDDLGDTLSRMNTSSDEVLSGSSQMAEGSQALADGTTRQASAIEEISATIAEVSTQIATTAQNAAQAGDLSKQTQDRVNEQDAEIQNMVQAMNEISNTSKEIEKIIKTIEDIAFQTNILALNAAVEAARAGDAGKGFAVVADEVRNLASKSAEAASSTTSLITASIEAVGKGSKIALSTAESMKDVKDMSTQTADLITEIASASAEQTESIKQITSGIEQISQVIQTNSATAEETAASCEELSGQSKLLKDQVARFRVNQ